MSHDSEREWKEPHSSTSRLLLESQVMYVQVEVRRHLVMHICSKLQSGQLIWILQNKNPREEEAVDGILERHQPHYK